MIDVPKCFYRVSIKALVLDDTKSKFMLLKEPKGVWELPGGGLDWGTSPQADLVREIQEEMGLSVKWVADHPSYFFPFINDDIWKVNVVYETELENLDFTPTDECIEIRFVTASEIQALNALPNVQAFAEQFDATQHQATHL